ncbi:hypothetical protein O181_038323 [Austropuccinia psidii MF-1]|uniref:Uncharacterized protein n=1 Tax=Austropuccinia psidii MF-1 TaxID=1389203 RepID=A0A9Q3HAX3_9BASI|nr:hypothetical protein [Austropuccinia psidii MF-1]
MKSHSIFFFSHRTKPTKSPTTTISCSPYALQANSAVTHSRPKWHPIFRGIILFIVLVFDSSEMTLPPFVEPSQHHEPPVCIPTTPIPGPSQASDSQLPSHENDSTLEPEPEVAPMQ